MFSDENLSALAREADTLLERLFPICRSITGEGVRETLRVLSDEVSSFQTVEVPSGTQCYDWKVPDEWNVREAFIADTNGNRLVDFSFNNVHLVSYSEPIDRLMSFAELDQHLYTLPKLPGAIPYRTAYYKRGWGFCLRHEQYETLDRSAEYHVKIDASFHQGGLTYGEALLHGTSGQEFLISSYCCHPSLANDNLSGLILWALLLRELKKRNTRHSYRFVVAPETIGAIAYLSRNEEAMHNVKAGFVVTTVAGPGPFGYKASFKKEHLIDRIARRAFSEMDIALIEYPFDVGGSDERQYSSPAFRIPVGTICKDKYYEYDYYHTSLDNLDFVSGKNLVQTLSIYLRAIEILEHNETYVSLNPNCEPQLGRRNLYPEVGGAVSQRAVGGGVIADEIFRAIRWLIFLSDGKTDLLTIAENTGLKVSVLYQAASLLVEENLLATVRDNRAP